MVRTFISSFTVMVILAVNSIFAGDVVFNKIPAQLQLFPRDAQDSAIVEISGYVSTAGFSEIALQVFKDSSLWKEFSQALQYTGGRADFSFTPKIHAEMSEYHFHVLLDDSLIARRDSIVCGDVYLINGQSNSHPNAASYSFSSEFCRSFGRHTNYSDYNPADTTWGLSNGQGWCDSCLYAVGTWGLRLQEYMLTEYGIPTCVLNGGSGGSTISYNLPDTSDRMNLTTTYGRLLYRATKAHVAGAVKAIFWHQGESDSYPSDDSLYFDRFSQLRAAWLQDYAPVERIYVFQLHPGSCGGEGQSYLRGIQRSFKDHFPEVHVMATNGLNGHDGCHYNDDGYLQMAQWVYRLVRRDFYGASDTLNVEAPDVHDIYYADQAQSIIYLDYDQPVIWPEDSLSASMKNYFYLDGNTGYVQSGYTINGGYTVVLELNGSYDFSVITYLPNSTYNRLPTRVYEGPWIRNERGVGALSFHELPIGSGPSAIRDRAPQVFRLQQNYPNPFNPQTKITYELKTATHVELAVYNTLGQRVHLLVNKNQRAGRYSLTFSGGDLPSGIYFYRLKTSNGFVQTKKMLLLR